MFPFRYLLHDISTRTTLVPGDIIATGTPVGTGVRFDPPHYRAAGDVVEVELAFVLGRPLQGPGVTMLDVLGATDYVIPALELIDGRTQYPRKIVDNIADNAAAAGVVLGGRAVRPLEVDLRWVGALLYRNGVIEETGVSAGVLGHPAQGIAWLANKIGPFGTILEAGHVLLAGSFTRTVAVKRGDTIHADYGPLGAISVHFG
jgi:2-oxo-hept-3-ene-1,7-dioate hydratase